MLGVATTKRAHAVLVLASTPALTLGCESGRGAGGSAGAAGTASGESGSNGSGGASGTGAAGSLAGGAPGPASGAAGAAGGTGVGGGPGMAGGMDTAGTGSGGADAGTGRDGDVDLARPPGGCSDPVDRTGPPAGKELLEADPIDTKFPFSTHFDNDGDLDVFAGESEGTAWIWENTDGKGTFKEHAVAMNARGHDARVGDVDCDGDLDIAGKPWGEGEPEPRDHIYLQNMTVERGGKAVFQRPKGELWRAGQTAEHCP